MARARVVDPDEQQMTVDVRMGRKAGRPPKDEADDPRLALPTGSVLAPEKKMATKESAATADLFSTYARNLAANDGDPVKAVAATMHISEEDATKDLAKHHEFLRSCSRSGISLADMLERHDLTREARVAVLRGHLYGKVPAASLKAIELLEEVDMTAKAARLGNTWEDTVRLAKERASKKTAKR